MERDADTDDDLRALSGLAYGLQVEGRLPDSFEPYLAAGADDVPEGTTRLKVGYRTLHELPQVEEVWASDTDWPAGGGHFGVFLAEGGFGLTVSAEGRGVFRCTRPAIGVEWQGPAAAAPHYLFAYALPVWLETEGVPVLHGSAVTIDGRAVGFLGASGMGKSLLCAELLRLGCGFLSDDGLALRQDRGGAWRCAQGPPLLRLWPSGLEGRLEIPAHPLPKVHETLDKRQLLLERDAAGFGGAGPALAALYVLDRRPHPEGPVEVERYTRRDALVRLIEHGIAGGPAAALGLSAGRLQRLGDLAEAVPVRRLGFPSGTDSAARIRDAILPDL